MSDSREPLLSVPHYRADGTFKHRCSQGYCPDLDDSLAPLREAANKHTDRVAPDLNHRYAERRRIEDAYMAGAAWQRTRDVQELESLRAMKERAEAEHRHYSRGKAYLERHEVAALLKRILEGESQGEGSRER